MPSGLRLRQALLSLLVFVSLTVAALQNVTVDDAVLVGPVVPEYLPYSAIWNQLPHCEGCSLAPDLSQAYNGTYHGALFDAGPILVVPQMNFSFTGSAIYIYTILSLAVPETGLSFILDGANVGTFDYLGSGGADSTFQYNVLAYSNNTLAYGLHNMSMATKLPTGSINAVIFDYLIYTTNVTDTSSSVTSSTSLTSLPSQTSLASPSQTSSAAGGKGSAPNNAIAGGVVGGLVAILLVIAGGFLCFRRHKRRKHDLSHSAEQVMIEDSPLPTPVTVPVPFRDTPSLDQQTIQRNRFAKQQSGNRTSGPDSPSPAIVAISSGPTGIASGQAVNGLLEQVELLREGVTHLARRQHNEEGGSIYEPDPLPPPQYSESIDSTRRSR